MRSLYENMLTSTAAAKASSKGGSKAATAYILVTCLPPSYRTPEILAPSLIGDSDEEAAYIGVYTVIVAVIAMSPQQAMPDVRLIRTLKRMNIGENTPIGKTEAVLKKMATQGYIWKVTERQNNGDEDITYHLGPRGKIEISKPGIRDFVKEVYGDTAPDDLEKRLNRSLNMDVAKIDQVNGAVDDEAEAGPSRSRRRRADEDDEDDE
jgi:DNA-binding PadR family transcriptional regulator